MEPEQRAHSATHSEPHEADARWMTFAELAAIRVTSKRAAVTLIRRHGWRRQRNNEGHVIALVPLTWARPSEEQEAHGEPNGEAHTAELAPLALAVLEAALAAADKRADAALALADRTMAQLADAAGRSDRDEALIRNLEADLRAKDVTIAETETRAREAEGAARIALGTVEALRREEEARKARGRWARLRAAWRGE